MKATRLIGGIVLIAAVAGAVWQVWASKSEAEVAAKHQSDASKITSIRVVDRQEVSPEQLTAQ